MPWWIWIVDHLEGIAFVTSIVVACGGLLALLSVIRFWPWVVPYYREFWAKLAVAFFRFVAAVAAVLAKSAAVAPGTPVENQPWVPTILIAAAGYLLWEFVGAIGDHNYKQAKEKSAEQYQAEIAAVERAKEAAAELHRQEIESLTQDRDDIEAQYLWLGRMVSHLRMLVNEKHQRIRRTLQASTTTRGSLPETRLALAPGDQIGMILEKLASLLHFEAAAAGHHNQNFRVGLYAEDQGHLVPIDAFDLNSRRHDPFTSYRQHTDWFRLDNTATPSHAGRCVREGRTLIVSDCAAHPDFRFFHDRQRNYLKSLIAYPLFDFSPDGGVPVRAALLIDTDVAGYFQEEDAEIIELCLKEFAVRIALEYAIRGLIG